MKATHWLIALICAAALVAGSAIATFAFERLPHLEDEVAYLFQAKTLALGRLTVPSPEHADAFWLPFVLDYQGRRFGKYSPGWPAILALGELVSAPWLVNPALTAVVLYLVYRLGRVLYDERTGLLAAALGLTSPLLLVLSGSYLSHLASLALLLAFTLWFVQLQVEEGGCAARWYSAAGAGAALGIAFLTRPLTAIGYAAPFALCALAQMIHSRRFPENLPFRGGEFSRPSLRRTAEAVTPKVFTRQGLSAAGAACGISPQTKIRPYLMLALTAATVAALLPAYQWAVTGDPWLNPYVLWWPYDRLGFGPGVGWMPGGHSPHYAWLNLRQDLATAATDVLGWPGLSWVPVALALAMPPRTWRERLLLAPFITLVVAYLFYWIGSPMRLWGPRYYFEGFGVLWVLAAVGLWRGWAWLHARPRWARAAALAVVAMLVAVNLGVNLPPRLAQARGFYGISQDQLRPVEEAGLHNALVFVKAERWLEYGAMLASMSPLLNDDVLYARSEGEAADALVMADYPERAVYYLEKGQLQLFRPAQSNVE